VIYLIGSLRNPEVPVVAAFLREQGHEVFDDWYAAGPNADDYWQAYEQIDRCHNFKQALAGEAANHIFEFDLSWLERCDTVVMLLPAGKSGHLEFGWAVGQGKRGFVLFPKEPDRYDVMYQFAHAVFFSKEELAAAL
jgi:nucleoside 2-deoxyribosyltransferase